AGRARRGGGRARAARDAGDAPGSRRAGRGGEIVGLSGAPVVATGRGAGAGRSRAPAPRETGTWASAAALGGGPIALEGLADDGAQGAGQDADGVQRLAQDVAVGREREIRRLLEDLELLPRD